MKKRVKAGIIAAVLLVAVLFVCNVVFRYLRYDKYKEFLHSDETAQGSEFHPLEEANPDVAGMQLAAENDNFKLYTNTQTTEIAVVDKRTGNVVRSNPEDRAEDAGAFGIHKEDLSSTLAVEYFGTGKTSVVVNNYNMSIQYGQFTLESIEDGIRYTYTLAEPGKDMGIVPTVISEERMQTLILDKLEKRDSVSVKGNYKLKDGYYTLMEKSAQSVIGMKKLNGLLEKAGYTEEDYKVDMESVEGEESISFTIPVEYRLTEDGFTASVPADEIKESGGHIYRLQLLKFLGAGGMKDDGYLFVPNGSGSLINFNNGKTKNAAFSQYVYGMDPVTQSYIVTENTENLRLPVFGIKNGDSALFAMITGGDALASINADVSGKLNSYNYAYPQFSMREMEVMNMFGATGNFADTPMLEKDFYRERLEVEYVMLSGEEADYSGMANYYRERLVSDGKLNTAETEALPFYLDILGGVEMKKHFLGVPYEGLFAMTTFDEAGKIADLLYEQGIPDIRMNYQGWFNGGVYHDAADKVDIMGKLGGKKDMERLAEKLEGKGGKLYGDTAFNKIPYTSRRFDYKLESSKYYSGYVVELGAVNPATLRQNSILNWYDELAYYAMSPKFLPRYVENYADEIRDVDITGIGLKDLGSFLTSDKRRTEVINRQMAEQIVTGQFEILDQTGKDILVNGGNLYALKYADDVIGVPAADSNYFIVDEEVPFYEMVMHGNLPYAGECINLSDDSDLNEIRLKYVEYGIAPRFMLSWEGSDNIKYTSSSDKYSVQYELWMDTAVEMYQELAGVLDQVAGSHMVKHETLADGLKKVTYDNGVSIYVNHTSQDVTEGAVTVPAESYFVEGGDADAK